MNNRRALFFQAVRGPVLLITIGSLFAIQQSGYASFGRTWPVLLIVIGLMKLLERSASPMIPYGAPPAGGLAPGNTNYGAPQTPPQNPNYPSEPTNTGGGLNR